MNNITYYSINKFRNPHFTDIDFTMEYCDGDIPPLTTFVIGDIDGSCGCTDAPIISPFPANTTTRSKLKYDYSEYFDGNNIIINLKHDHEIIKISLIDLRGRVLHTINTSHDKIKYDISVNLDRNQIYTLTYFYKDHIQSSFIPIF